MCETMQIAVNSMINWSFFYYKYKDQSSEIKYSGVFPLCLPCWLFRCWS